MIYHSFFLYINVSRGTIYGGTKMTNYELIEKLLNFINIEDFNRMNLKCISFTKCDVIVYFDLGTICVPKKLLNNVR